MAVFDEDGFHGKGKSKKQKKGSEKKKGEMRRKEERKDVRIEERKVLRLFQTPRFVFLKRGC